MTDPSLYLCLCVIMLIVILGLSIHFYWCEKKRKNIESLSPLGYPVPPGIEIKGQASGDQDSCGPGCVTTDPQEDKCGDTRDPHFNIQKDLPLRYGRRIGGPWFGRKRKLYWEYWWKQ